MHIPRLLISALRGGAGKTLLSLGLARALSAGAIPVKPFKKGPDYIDAAWLARAAHCPCTNLDPFFLPPERLQSLFQHAWTQAQGKPQLALIEGNRGLFDGRDAQGSCSSAELARILGAPVLLSLDCTKMTRTAAAVVAGLASFEPGVRLGGVVLNQLASPRHESIVRQSIETYTDIPVLGALPRLRRNPLPERHMGLVLDAAQQCSQDSQQQGQQNDGAHAVLEELGAFIAAHVDVGRIVDLARTAKALPAAAPFWQPTADARQTLTRPRMGIVRDAALWFYYHENLEALERAGAELVPLSLLDHAPWPALDGLYLGGGFPEEYAAQLAASPHLEHIRGLSAAGAPIYAECGGFMLLSESIVRDGTAYPMAGIFPVSAHFHPRPQGLGYVEATVAAANPFHPVGTSLRGHEFHYSHAVAAREIGPLATLTLQTGTGMGSSTHTHVDGLCLRQTFAAYTHIFAPAVPWWAENFVAAARVRT